MVLTLEGVETMKAYQHMKAPNDTNGNPRRLFMVYDGSTQFAVDEGYKGKPKFLNYCRHGRNWGNGDDFQELMPVDISPKEYRKILAEFAGSYQK